MEAYMPLCSPFYPSPVSYSTGAQTSTMQSCFTARKKQLQSSYNTYILCINKTYLPTGLLTSLPCRILLCEDSSQGSQQWFPESGQPLLQETEVIHNVYTCSIVFSQSPEGGSFQYILPACAGTSPAAATQTAPVVQCITSATPTHD